MAARRRRNDYFIGGMGAAAGLTGTNYYRGGRTNRSMYGQPAGPTQRGRHKAKPRAVYKSKTKKLQKQVTDIKRVLNSTTSQHTWKKDFYSRFLTSANTAEYLELTGWNHATIANAVGNLRFFDPTTPGTLIVADADAGLFNRDILIPSIYVHCEARNNYAVPAKLTIYLLKSKVSTNTDPDTYRTNGLADQGNPTESSIQLYPTDSNEFNEQWSIVTSKTRTLQGGQTMSLSYSVKNVNYNPAQEDTNNLTYEKGTLIWYARLQGVMGHDTTISTQTGILGAGVDIMSRTIIKIKYDSGGGSLDDITVVDGQDTFTNAGCITNKDVIDKDLVGG